MTGNIYDKMFVLSVWFVVLTSPYHFVRAQVSGNAIDLANMNMNMMHMKCPLEPCQSVCLKKEPETGCFICDPKCNTGNSLGMPDSRLPMNMQPMNTGTGQTSFYSGCEHDNWMQCPMSCQRNFDQKGCFKCLCRASSTLRAPQSSMQTLIATSKSSQQILSSTPWKSVKPERIFSFPPTRNNTLTTETSTSITTNTNPLQTTEKLTTKNVDMSRTKTVFSSSKPKVVQDDIRPKPHNLDRHGQLKSTGYHSYDKNSSTTTSAINEKVLMDQNTALPYVNEFKPNNLTFVLFGIMIVLVTFSFVFFIAWRKSSRKLKKNKDELYFVHKAYRQDSNARLSNNEMMDPVYSDINPRPDPPPRSPYLNKTDATSEGPFTTNMTNDGPFRSFSQSSDTPLKEHFEECKHDYLELI